MIRLFIAIFISIPIVLPVMNDQENEINEGHLYHEEIQSNRIKEKKLKEIIQRCRH